MVSIIVPVFNVERYIDECIESLINQTYQDIEIVLVDDGSTDDSGLICEKFKEKDSRIIVVHKENGGLSSAIKAGLIIASGKQVAFVDSDDWVECNYIEVMLDAMEDSNCDLVCANGYINSYTETSTRFHNGKGVVKGDEISREIYPGLFACMDSLGYRIAPARCAKLFLREQLLRNIRFYKESVSLGEDSLMTFPYVLCCKGISFIDDRIYHYRMNSSSISRTFKKKNLDDLVYCVHQYGVITKELTHFDFSKQLSARQVEIVYRTLHEIIENINEENKTEMFQCFQNAIQTFDEYPVFPYSGTMRREIQYKLIQHRRVTELWWMMLLWKKLRFSGRR